MFLIKGTMCNDFFSFWSGYEPLNSDQRSLQDSTILHGVVHGVREMKILKPICDALTN